MPLSRTVLLIAVFHLFLVSIAVGQTANDQVPADNVIVGEVVQENPGQDQKDLKVRRKKKKSSMAHFMRIRRDNRRKPVAFESSVTRYLGLKDGETVTVDLIGVVHIGEQEYYDKLNELFENYDSVLYELVAPEGTVVEKNQDPRESMNPIAAMQVMMQTALGLEFQLQHIDYKADNFRHADMSPDEFLESMKDNDESFTKIAFKAIGQSMAQSSRGTTSNLDLLRVALAKDKEIQMRRLFAKQMMDMEGGMAIFEGRDGSTIINHRNGKALEVMRDEIENGKRRIAIFYGAGHLPDFERRLMSTYQMKRGGQFWLKAWKLKR